MKPIEKNDSENTNTVGEQATIPEQNFDECKLKMVAKTPAYSEAVRQHNNYSRDVRNGWRFIKKADEPANDAAV